MKLPQQPNKMLSLNWKTKTADSYGHAHTNLTCASSAAFPTATPKTLLLLIRSCVTLSKQVEHKHHVIWERCNKAFDVPQEIFFFFVASNMQLK